MKRKTVLLVMVALLVSSACLPSLGLQKSKRPPVDKRKFTSEVIEQVIVDVSSRMKDAELAELFVNCFPNVLDTTVNYNAHHKDYDNQADTFVITGDIPAMWLRDSHNQVWPYLPYAAKDAKLQDMFRGVINRMVHSVLLDPYANAFNYNASGGEWQTDFRRPPMTPPVWEGKYELDSLMAVLRLSYGYYEATNDTSVFGESWAKAVDLILNTVVAQQQDSLNEEQPPYQFGRVSETPTDTLLHHTGPPVAYTGMTKSPFRPSDDASTLQFLVPANAMAVVALSQTQMLCEILGLQDIATRSADLAAEIQNGITDHALLDSVSHGTILAYEVDGYDNVNFMDDANVPSLLSLPYLGYVNVNDLIYQRTRRFILSAKNPYYFSGTKAAGVGSPHTGLHRVWPLSLIMQALTSTDDDEISGILDMLKVGSAGTGFMHEGFNVNDPADYTRPWFAWANSMFGQLILTLAEQRPHLVFDA